MTASGASSVRKRTMSAAISTSQYVRIRAMRAARSSSVVVVVKTTPCRTPEASLVLAGGGGRGGGGGAGGAHVPGHEGVRHTVEGLAELREVPQEDASHVVVGHPLEPGPGVVLLGVAVRDEPVALEPSAGHQDEDPEGGVAEAESLRRRLGVHAHLQVDLLDVAVD